MELLSPTSTLHSPNLMKNAGNFMALSEASMSWKSGRSPYSQKAVYCETFDKGLKTWHMHWQLEVIVFYPLWGIRDRYLQNCMKLEFECTVEWTTLYFFKSFAAADKEKLQWRLHAELSNNFIRRWQCRSFSFLRMRIEQSIAVY